MSKRRDAFTLIEVMVSVVIISVVIMALLQMQGNNTHIFSKLISKLEINQYASFLLANKDYGFEKKSVYLDDLLSEFRVEDDLRRKLKNIRLKIKYDKLNQYGDKESSQDDSSDILLEVGKSTVEVDNSAVSLIRLKLQ